MARRCVGRKPCLSIKSSYVVRRPPASREASRGGPLSLGRSGFPSPRLTIPPRAAAGPLFDGAEQSFFNLELEDTNVTDHNTHTYGGEGYEVVD